MKVFHKDADYAVRTLLYLAATENANYISATALAKEIGLPLNFLRRICSLLIRAGYLDSREGAGGGVRLLRDPKKINVLEIMTLFHGPPELSECKFRKALCPNRESCVLRKRILKIEDYVKQEFQSITLASLLEEIRGE